MKHIWAPWRIEYILGKKTPGCFLCDAFASDNDAANLVIRRSRRTAVILNRYPYTGGHIMVCPYRHVDSLAALDRAEHAEMMYWAAASETILKKEMNADGFNIGLNLGEAAGAGLKDHLHLHVVPRWAGDTNYVTVLGDLRVIPQALEDLAATLSRPFAAIPDPD